MISFFQNMSLNLNRLDLVHLLHGSKKRDAGVVREFGNVQEISQDLEFVLSNVLRRMCDRRGVERNKRESAKVLHKLGKVYRLRSPDKISLIRSLVLFNAALVRNPDNSHVILTDVREICTHVLDLAGFCEGKISLTDKAKDVALKVREMREMVASRLAEVDKIENVQLEERNNQIKKIHLIEKTQEDIYDAFTSIMKDVMDYCLSLTDTVPCRYALTGLGSVPKKEITPYSDFEHVFLLEEGIQLQTNYKEILEYFRWVTVIFQFVLVNMGETIVPIINLPFLNDPFHKPYDWFFDIYTRRGVSFDGMVPYACKFPLGRPRTPNKPWKTELIKPASEMLKYLEKKQALKNGYHLADMLMKTCFVGGSKEIYQDFVDRRRDVMNYNDHVEDLRNFINDDVRNFNPVGSLDAIAKNKKWNIKRVVYRSAGLFVMALGRLHRLESTSSFDTIRQLAAHNLIDSDFAHELSYAMSIACHLRLHVYSEKGGQDDWVDSPQQTESFDLLFVQSMGVKAPVLFFRTAMKLQRKTCQQLGIANEPYLQLSQDVDHLLACFWLQQYDDTANEAVKLSQNQTCDETSIAIVNEVLLAVGHFHNERGSFHKGLRCFQRLRKNWASLYPPHVSDDTAHGVQRTAECFYFLERYQNALDLHEEELTIRKAENSNQLQQKHIALCVYNSACCHFQLKNYDDALEYFRQAKIMWGTFADPTSAAYARDCTSRLGDILFIQDAYEEALKQHKLALQLLKQLPHNVSSDEDASSVHEKVGDCYESLGNYTEALENFSKAKNTLVYKTARTKTSVQTRLLGCSNKIANVLFELGRYEESLKENEKTLSTAVSFDERLNSVLAWGHYNAARCFVNLRICRKAAPLLDKARQIWKISKDPHAENHLVHCALWTARCLSGLGEHEEALKMHEQAVSLRKEIFADHASDKDLALCYYSAAECCSGQLNCEEKSFQYFQAAKAIWKHSGDASFESKMADCAHSMGTYIFNQGNFEEALKEFEEALAIRKRLLGDPVFDFKAAMSSYNAGQSCLRLQTFEQALRYFKDVNDLWAVTEESSSHPLRTECAKWIGRCLVQLGRLDDAVVHYTSELSAKEDGGDVQNRDYAVLHNNIGACLYQLDKFPDAVEHFVKAKETFEKVNLAAFKEDIENCANSLGRCLFQMGRFEEAADQYRDALNTTMQKTENHRKDRDVSDYYHMIGRCRFEMKRYREALGLFEKSKTTLDESADLSLKDGIVSCENWIRKCSFELGDYVGSLQYHQKEVKASHENADDQTTIETSFVHCYNAARSHFNLKQYEEALNLFAKAKNVWDDQSSSFQDYAGDCCNWMGRCLYELGRLEQAFQHFESAFNHRIKSSADPKSDLVLALIYKNAAFSCVDFDKTKSLELFTAAKAIYEFADDPSVKAELAECVNCVARCLFDLKRYEDALGQYESALALKASLSDEKEQRVDFAANYSNAAYCCVKVNKNEDAVLYFDKAIRTWENVDQRRFVVDIAEHECLLGKSIIELGRHEEALRHINKALCLRRQLTKTVSSDKEIGVCYFFAAHCYLGLERFESAVEAFLQAKQIFEANPSNETCKQLLKRCEENMAHGLACMKLDEATACPK